MVCAAAAEYKSNYDDAIVSPTYIFFSFSIPNEPGQSASIYFLLVLFLVVRISSCLNVRAHVLPYTFAS